jgi:hypothetical protein
MKVPLGTPSPTLIAMILSSRFRNEFRPLYSMTRKSGYRFSEKIMLKQEAKAKW